MKPSSNKAGSNRERRSVDAKLLGHLTELNTQALLAIASDLLGQLTKPRFGFAGSFEIVSRNSGVVHTPSRFSGGEKFLASVAPALAELPSFSGPRLGSLFLDEGFAALDTTASGSGQRTADAGLAAGPFQPGTVPV